MQDRSHKKQQKPRRTQTVNPYTARIVKPPSKQHLKDVLRHAVAHNDQDAYEDYDEWDA